MRGLYMNKADIKDQLKYLDDFYIEIKNKNLINMPTCIEIKNVILKVSHHGSKTGNNDVLINAIAKYVNLMNGYNADNDNNKYLEISFISCGNQYGLPDKETVNCLIQSTFDDNIASDSKNSRNRNNELKKTAKLHNTTPKLLNLTPDSFETLRQ